MRMRIRTAGIRRAAGLLLALMILSGIFPFDLPFMNSSAQAGTAASAADLDKTVIRIRPAGNRTSSEVGTSVGVRENGDGGATRKNVLELFDINDSSRFYLVKAGDNCFNMRFFKTSDNDTGYLNSKYVDLDSSKNYKKEGAAVHVYHTSDGSANNRKWRLWLQSDGTYYIQNVHSGLYWALEKSSYDDGTRIVQQPLDKATRWEIEISHDSVSRITSNQEKYDTYSYYLNSGLSSGRRVTSSNWMTALPDNTLLTDLSIPGAHDAVACNMNWSNGKAQTQQLVLEDLLYSGVRYIDLRIGMDMYGNLIGCHNDTQPKYNGQLMYIETIKSMIYNFLNKHPGETVILQVGPHTTFNTGLETHERKVLAELKTWDKIYKWESADPKMPTLGDVRGKIVILDRFKWIHDANLMLDVHNWQQGDDSTKSHKRVTSLSDFEVWSQDKYSMKGDDKDAWINASLFNKKPTPCTRRKRRPAAGKNP